MKTKNIALSLTLVSFAAPIAMANEATHKQNVPQTAAVTATDQGMAVKDTAITKTIRERIVADKTLSMKAKNITIVTNGGRVLLRGPVASAQEKTKVESIAKSVSGTTGMENLTEISN